MADFRPITSNSSVSSLLKKTEKPVPGPPSTEVDWTDYNFPPCVKVVHFSLKDFQGTELRVIKKLYVSWGLLMTSLSLGVLSSFVLSSTELSNLIILYALLNFVLIGALGTYVFFCGYSGIAKQKSFKLLIYKAGQVLLSCMYLLFSIISSGAFNGWAKISSLEDMDDSAADFGILMCVVESLLYTVNSGLGLYCAYLVHTTLSNTLSSL
jgi:hypothetical protein